MPSIELVTIGRDSSVVALGQHDSRSAYITLVGSAGLALNSAGPLSSRVEAFESATIRAELERTRHNMTETAKALGLERSHLYKKCAQLGIQLKQLRHQEG